MDEAIRLKLLEIGAHDEAMHETVGGRQLSSDPVLAASHQEYAAQIEALIERSGWPDASIAGADGAEAAWRLVYHLIDQPDFERRMLALLGQVCTAGGIEAWKVAMLEDRICASEGRAQNYGTRLDWNERGEVAPDPPVSDPANVDDRRSAVGLPPLSHSIEVFYSASQWRPRPTAAQVAERRGLFERLAREAGWRK